MRLLSADWRRAGARATAPVPIAGKVHRSEPNKN
jgi:hypothetical protein